MAQKNPAKVRAEAAQHVTNAVGASCKLDDLLSDPKATDAEILKAAKVLEAAGCYVRRALAKSAIGEGA